MIIIQGFIKFDYGSDSSFYYTNGFSCTNSSTISRTINFSGTFENVPEILIVPNLIAITKNYFHIDIISIDQTSFTLKIICVNQSISRYIFNWYAFSNSRVKILRPLRQSNTTDGNIFIHMHQQFQVKQAIVILESWSMIKGYLNFSLEVYEVTSTSIKIKLHNSNSNLLEIEYSVVLGTQEAFTQSGIISTQAGTGILYSKSLKLLNKGVLSLPFVGFQWDDDQPIRMGLIQTQVPPNIQYVCQACKQKSYQLVDSTIMNSIRFYEVQFFEQILFPMYIYSYRITNKYERYISNAIKIQILELNQQFVSFGDYSVQIPVEMNKITIQIELKFMPNEKLVGQFLKCNECGTKNVYKIDQNYLGGYNFIRYRLLLRQYSINTQDLIISIGLSTVNIKQIINQVVTDYDIVQLQFINLQL